MKLVDKTTESELPSGRSSAQFVRTAMEIREMAEELSTAAAHPEFLKMIQEVQDADDEKKIAVAKANARADQVAARGVSLPNTFRLTTRTFEDPIDADDFEQSTSSAPIVAFSGGRGYVSYNGSTIMVTGSEPDEAAVKIRQEIKGGIEEIGVFVTSAPFQRVLRHLASEPAGSREDFVSRELLDPEARQRWNLVVPSDMHIQRSAFADGRPTLFCVTKVLPLAHPWHKVTITFDDTNL